MNEVFFFSAIIISITALIAATYTDLKWRIVPNKLNYGLAILGLVLFAIESIAEGSYLPLVYSLFGLAFGFGFGWVLWKLGVFAGGDVKLFMALGALNPITPAIIKNGILDNAQIAGINAPIFPITLFIYSLISFLPYGIFVISYRLAKNKKFQKDLAKEMKPKILLAIHAMLFAPAVYIILGYFKTPALIGSITTLVLLVAWSFLGKNKKYATIIALILGAIISWQLLAQGIIAGLIISVALYTLIRIMFASRKLLAKEINISNLEEGMIPAKSIIYEGKKVVEEKGINYKEIISLARKGEIDKIRKMFAQKEEIISARKARGMTDEEIKTVKKLAAKGLIPKKMLIKDSMPFVPTVLIGYILCLILGDIVLKIIFMGVL